MPVNNTGANVARWQCTRIILNLVDSRKAQKMWKQNLYKWLSSKLARVIVCASYLFVCLFMCLLNCLFTSFSYSKSLKQTHHSKESASQLPSSVSVWTCSISNSRKKSPVFLLCSCLEIQSSDQLYPYICSPARWVTNKSLKCYGTLSQHI